MAFIDNLVDIRINIDNTVTPTIDYNNVLLVGYEPDEATQDTMPPRISVYNSLTEVGNAWGMEEAVYKAADIAFRNGANTIIIATIIKNEYIYTEATPTAEEIESWPENKYYIFSGGVYSVATEYNAGTTYYTRSENDISTKISEALENSLTSNYGYYAVYVAIKEHSYIQTVANWCATNGKLFGYAAMIAHTSDGAKFYYADGEAVSYENEKYSFTGDGKAFVLLHRGIVSTSGSADTIQLVYPDNIYSPLALMCVCAKYQAGSETWAYKSLVGITAENFSNAEYGIIKDYALNPYVNVAGNSITLNGQIVSNDGTSEYIDIIRLREWIITDMQSNVFNLLVSATKIPYTPAGIASISSAMRTTLENARNAGGVTSYTISTPSVYSRDDRLNRKIKLTFTAQLAGAIHLVTINGTISV